MPVPIHPPPLEDAVIVARYPFMPQARPAIKAHMDANNVDIDALVETDWLEEVRTRARVRLIESILHKEIDINTDVDIHSS